jgi:hypothetical protein
MVMDMNEDTVDNKKKFEGFVPPEKNFFHMPNIWTDISADIDSLAEIKIIEYVIRHTWGYQEYGITKTITNDEFQFGRKRSDGSRIDKGTGLSDRSVKDGIKRAIAEGYIYCEVDDSDKARIKKSYGLTMFSSVEGKNLPPEIRGEVSTPRTGSIYPSGSKNVPPYQEDSTHRTEKDTKERNQRKTPKEKQENIASNDAPLSRLSSLAEKFGGIDQLEQLLLQKETPLVPQSNNIDQSPIAPGNSNAAAPNKTGRKNKNKNVAREKVEVVPTPEEQEKIAAEKAKEENHKKYHTAIYNNIVKRRGGETDNVPREKKGINDLIDFLVKKGYADHALVARADLFHEYLEKDDYRYNKPADRKKITGQVIYCNANMIEMTLGDPEYQRTKGVQPNRTHVVAAPTQPGQKVYWNTEGKKKCFNPSKWGWMEYEQATELGFRPELALSDREINAHEERKKLQAEMAAKKVSVSA